MDSTKLAISRLSSRDREAVIALLVRHAKAWWEQKHKTELKEKIEKEISGLSQQITDCEAGFRAFGLNAHDQGVWAAMRDAFEDEVTRAMAPDEIGEQAGSSLTQLLLGAHGKPSARVQDLVLERLKDEFPLGSKAAPIRDFVENKLGRSIHSKTVGMTLYRLLNKRLVSRQGHTWFFVPPSAETKNPAGDTAGLVTSS